MKKRGGWEVLHWAMTEADAAQWARHNGVDLQKVEGSREERQDLYGDGDRQVLPAAPGKGATFFPAHSPPRRSRNTSRMAIVLSNYRRIRLPSRRRTD